jgi:hypothetical protein
MISSRVPRNGLYVLELHPDRAQGQVVIVVVDRDLALADELFGIFAAGVRRKDHDGGILTAGDRTLHEKAERAQRIGTHLFRMPDDNVHARHQLGAAGRPERGDHAGEVHHRLYRGPDGTVKVNCWQTPDQRSPYPDRVEIPSPQVSAHAAQTAPHWDKSGAPRRPRGRAVR